MIWCARISRPHEPSSTQRLRRLRSGTGFRARLQGIGFQAGELEQTIEKERWIVTQMPLPQMLWLLKSLPGAQLCPAAKKMRGTAKALAANHLQHQVRTGDAFHVHMALVAPHPNGRHPIRRGEGCTLEYPHQARITLCFHDAMDPNQADITFAPLLEIVLDPGECLLHVDGVDTDAQHIRFQVMTAIVHECSLSFQRRDHIATAANTGRSAVMRRSE